MLPSPPEDHVVAIWQRAVRTIVVYGHKTLHRLPVPADFAGLAEWPESEVVHELEHLLWRVPTRPLQRGIQLENDREAEVGACQQPLHPTQHLELMALGIDLDEPD